MIHKSSRIESFVNTFKMPKRYFVAVWTAFGGFVLFVIRSNLAIALIDMTSNKTKTNETELTTPEFHFSMSEKGFILGAFSFGFGFSFLIGYLPYKFGGVTMYGIGVLLTGILALLSPILVRLHLYAFLFARALQGLFEGLALAATMNIFTHWAPPTERTRLVTSVRLGATAGVAINFPLSGYVAHHWGWSSIFYFSGAIVLLWYVVWFFFITNDPADDKFISEEEKLYLKNMTQSTPADKLSVPWKEIFTSKPIYALFNEFFVIGWTYSFITFNFPLYINDVLYINTQDVGLLTGIPMICGVIMIFISAWTLDYLRSHIFTISKVHKMAIFWGESIVLLSLLITAIWGNFFVCIICFSIMRMAFSIAETSYIVIPMDLAGQYGSIVLSICTSISSVGSFCSPLVLGYIVRNNTQSEWNLYFSFLSVITMYGVVMFCKFGSGELQTWAITK